MRRVPLFYLYLVQVRHFDVLKAAGFTALPWVATIFAIPLGGVLSDVAVGRWGAVWDAVVSLWLPCAPLPSFWLSVPGLPAQWWLSAL